MTLSREWERKETAGGNYLLDTDYYLITFWFIKYRAFFTKNLSNML